jgi:hypothetical protein
MVSPSIIKEQPMVPATHPTRDNFPKKDCAVAVTWFSWCVAIGECNVSEIHVNSAVFFLASVPAAANTFSQNVVSREKRNKS